MAAATAMVMIAGMSDPPGAHARTSVVYTAKLDGPSEAPPNASPGTGTAFVTIDDMLNTMRVQASFSGLNGLTTAAHIHAATTSAGIGLAGVATTTPTFPGFPLNVLSGSYHQLFDMTLASSYRTGFITANGGTTATAQAALFRAIEGGKAYFNIHTNSSPGGEIRGFFTPVPVPGPLPLLGVGAAFGWSRRLRRRQRLGQLGS